MKYSAAGQCAGVTAPRLPASIFAKDWSGTQFWLAQQIYGEDENCQEYSLALPLLGWVCKE